MTIKYPISDSEPHSLLPVPTSTLSYWRTQPHHLDEHRSTPDLPPECDILIIGGGLAGVSTAYHLVKSASSSAEPQPSIVILEARQTCSGATGRNGGHVKVKTASMLDWIKSHGQDTAEELHAFVRETIYATKDAVETEGLDCEFEMRRSFDVFLDQGEGAQARDAFVSQLKTRKNWIRDVSVIERFSEELTSVKGAKTAFSTPACSLWPYKFVTQLLERAISTSKGAINLQTHTPVTSVSATSDGSINIVTTPRGIIHARKLVFATNAYTSSVLPQYRNVIVPVRGQAAHLAIPAESGRPKVQPHLSNTYNIDFGAQHVDYFNPRPDGGIVLGGGKWLYAEDRKQWFNNVDDSTLIEQGKAHFDNYMQRNFLGWKNSGCETERVWTGIMGYTPDSLPHVGLVPGTRNQYILAGFNGGGMPLIFLTAKGVAKMVKDEVPFEDDGVGIPALFKTTEERLVPDVEKMLAYRA